MNENTSHLPSTPPNVYKLSQSNFYFHKLQMSHKVYKTIEKCSWMSTCAIDPNVPIEDFHVLSFLCWIIS